MKLNKTESKLIENLKKSPLGRAGYYGAREANAAATLEKKGLVVKNPESGWYEHRCFDGSYTRKYVAQGYITAA